MRVLLKAWRYCTNLVIPSVFGHFSCRCASSSRPPQVKSRTRFWATCRASLHHNHDAGRSSTHWQRPPPPHSCLFTVANNCWHWSSTVLKRHLKAQPGSSFFINFTQTQCRSSSSSFGRYPAHRRQICVQRAIDYTFPQSKNIFPCFHRPLDLIDAHSLCGGIWPSHECTICACRYRPRNLWP